MISSPGMAIMRSATVTNRAELKWLPIPLDLWVPAGLKDFQEGWFVNLLRASLRSEFLGYLILCEEGCSGCSACLWRVANAHHPEHFKKHCSLVLACFNSAQIAEHRVLYFPKLVETIKGQLSKIKNHRSRRGGLSETSTAFNKGGGPYSPSGSLGFDFELDSKKQNSEANIDCALTTEDWMAEGSELGKTDIEKAGSRLLRILGLSDSNLSAAAAAVESEFKRTGMGINDVVISLTNKARLARKESISDEEFLNNFSALASARQLLQIVNLPVMNKFIYRIAAVLKAEAADTGLSLEDTAKRIEQLASEDRQRGRKVDIFYFEDMRWRSNARVSKAEERKLGNLAANARAKEILRERLR
jgi:hypothetical protein